MKDDQNLHKGFQKKNIPFFQFQMIYIIKYIYIKM